MKTQSGLYLLKFSDGRYYGGRSFDIEGRSLQHSTSLASGRHRNRHVQRAYEETGLFELTILDLIEDQEDLLSREQEWLDQNHGRPGCLNIFSSAKGRQLGFKHSAETREKFRFRKISPETRRKIAETLRGRTLSTEHREAIARGNAGRTISPEHAAILRECSRNRVWTPEMRARHSEASLGHVRTDESIEKQVETWRSRPGNLEKARASIDGNRKKITPEAIAARALKTAEKLKGRKHSPEHVEKVRQKHLGRKNTPETIEKMRQAALDRCAKKPPSHGEATRSLISSQQKGRVWINNGVENRRVFLEEAEKLLTEGWSRGRRA